MPVRRITALAAATVALAAASPALAQTATRTDAAGRTITFDLQATGVDVDGYAAILSGALHGNEISAVTIRVVPPPAIATECGAGAAACFERAGRVATITVPAEAASAVRDALVHEYGHHIDATVRHQAGSCPDGTPRWWAARGAAAALAGGRVACDYSAGWDHSIAEVYAEDYRVLNVPGATSRGVLGQPSAAVLEALRLDIATLDGATPAPPPGSTPEPVPPPDPGTPVAGIRAGGASVPVLRPGRGLSRAGALGAKGVSLIRFRVAVRQRVVLVVRRRGAAAGDFVVTLRCGTGPVLVGDGRRGSLVRVAGRVGPGACTATIRAGRKGLRFTSRLRMG